MQFLTRTFSLLLCVVLFLSASPVPVRAAFFSDVAFDKRATLTPTTTPDTCQLTDATGWELTAKDGRKFFFAADGRLESMRDPQGNTLTILRDGGERGQL